MHPHRSLISLFARHRVAANLLMMIMVLMGVWALWNLNTQLLPTYGKNIVTVEVVWTGASAEDVETSVIVPLEKEFRSLEHLDKMTSQASQSNAKITLEFDDSVNDATVLEQVRKRVSLVRNLPEDAEEPLITKQEVYEVIARLIISGPEDLQELRPLVHRFERELLSQGIAKVEVIGLPDQQITVQIPSQILASLHLSLTNIAEIIARRSQDAPAGTFGKGALRQQIRSLSQQRSIIGFEDIPLITDNDGHLLRLGDVADISLRPQEGEVEASYQGKPAVEMVLSRTEGADALHEAKVLDHWLAQVKPTLPSTVKLHVYEKNWEYIKQRIDLLLKNGLGGFILILILLFLFLNRRVAIWVVAGIPVSFMASLAVLHLTGGSINMVSLFAMIMALGIIVDDTIVVGEEALSLYDKGLPILEAVETGARRMLAPIMASSITTICAFLPLLLIGDTIGAILRAIPQVVICIIIASLIECFLILPGHLYHSFRKLQAKHTHPLRDYIDTRFNHFREKKFRPFVARAIHHRWLTLSIALASFIIAMGIVASGWINFNFFPSPDGQMISADVQFVAGTPQHVMVETMQQLQNALWQTDEQLSETNKNLVETAVTFINKGSYLRNRGMQYAAIMVEMIPPDNRDVLNKEFIKAWRKNFTLPPVVENLVISPARAGPPGQDIDIQLSGENISQLKTASLELQQELSAYAGVSQIEDNLPYGQQQLIYSLTPEGRSVGLAVADVGRQLRSAFTGSLAQIYHQPNEEIEVRVELPDNERNSLSTLENYPIVTSAAEMIPLGSVVDLRSRRGFDIIRHTDTQLTVHVTAEVDADVSNSNKIIASLQRTVLPNLEQKYGVSYALEGRADEQRETLQDMKFGMFIAFVLIYIVLAWVFASYGWPFVVLVAVPLGLVGAIFGHLIMGKDLTVLSLFGFFALSGIVINDSIILVSRYKALRDEGLVIRKAIVEASCQRLRAVLLTSLTTIAGLTPLLFESSLQAQFLIPMAISITYGLAFATLLILIVIPALLSIYEDTIKKYQKGVK